jgi:hypothetical protein
MLLVSTCIQHQTAVTVITSDYVNRHSSSFKIVTELEEWTKEEVLSVICFCEQKKFHLLQLIVSW